MTSKIYKITNLVNGKIYVGYTKRSLEERFHEHAKCENHKSRCMPIAMAIKKYGYQNFKIELLEESDDDKYIHFERERHWIKILNAQDSKVGYNIADGGDGGDTLSRHPFLDEIKMKMSNSQKHRKRRPVSEETKKKLSESHKGKPGYIPTEEERKLMSERMKGEKNPNFGTHLTPERKCFMSKVHSGNVYWNNGIENKRSKSCPGEGWVKGILVTEESRQLRSNTHKGKVSAFKGKKHTDEVKKSLSTSHKGLFNGDKNPSARTVEIISPNGERFVVKGTVKAFCEEHGISYNVYRKYRNKGPYKLNKYVAKDNPIVRNTEGWVFNLIG